MHILVVMSLQQNVNLIINLCRINDFANLFNKSDKLLTEILKKKIN